MPGPVQRFHRLGVSEAARGVARDQGDRRWLHRPPGQQAADHVNHWPQHGAVEGRERQDRSAGESGFPQRGRGSAQRFVGAGDHRLPGRVDRPDVDAWPQIWCDFLVRGCDGSHAARGRPGQVVYPMLKETDGIVEIEDAGQGGSGQFADAVTEHDRRTQS